MTNTLIGEQISRQINFFAANIYRRFFFVEETYDHVRGNGRGSSFTDMQILDDAWKIAENCVNEFFTNLPPKTWTSMQYNDLLPA